ncbi:hypothetical protein BY996DRAFT_6410721 [Phakopsora pachyrhizi]|uniref:Expressed protein n=1 Tax=Phakopsora pachyrhizi TaxID=170000 RepID=A0AAV0BMY9_PHAPC|nr:hypothetical protein BY996DRAFT_6410721 [Phakopsora pachyrhizi]CAH7688022.1 expressed protein [Phakopsora pachyrhizi]
MERRQNFAFLVGLLATFSFFGLITSLPMNAILTATDTAKATHTASEAGTSAKITEKLEFSDALDMSFSKRIGDHVEGEFEAANDAKKKVENLKFESREGQPHITEPYRYVFVESVPKPNFYAKIKALISKIWKRIKEGLRRIPKKKNGQKISNSKPAKKTTEYFQKGKSWASGKLSKSKLVPENSASEKVSPASTESTVLEAENKNAEVNPVKPKAAPAPESPVVKKPSTVESKSTANGEPENAPITGNSDPSSDVNKIPKKKISQRVSNSKPVKKTSEYYEKGMNWVNGKIGKSKLVPENSASEKVSPAITESTVLEAENKSAEINPAKPKAAPASGSPVVEKPATVESKSTPNGEPIKAPIKGNSDPSSDVNKIPKKKISQRVSNSKPVKKTGEFYEKGMIWVNGKIGKSKQVPENSASKEVSPANPKSTALGAENKIPEVNPVKPEAAPAPKNPAVEKTELTSNGETEKVPKN